MSSGMLWRDEFMSPVSYCVCGAYVREKRGCLVAINHGTTVTVCRGWLVAGSTRLVAGRAARAAYRYKSHTSKGRSSIA